MSFVLMRNIGGTQVGNPGGTKNFFAAAYCQIIYGIVPVCGFGHFASGCKFNALSYWSPTTYGGADYSGLVFDDQWPNVYQTLVESLTDGTNTSTRTITYTQTIDNLVTYSVNDPNGWFDGIGDIGFESPPGATTTIGPTSLNIQWTEQPTFLQFLGHLDRASQRTDCRLADGIDGLVSCMERHDISGQSIRDSSNSRRLLWLGRLSLFDDPILGWWISGCDRSRNAIG